MNKTVGTMEAGLGSRVLGKIKGFFREYAIIYAVLALIVILSFASPKMCIRDRYDSGKPNLIGTFDGLVQHRKAKGMFRMV